MSDEFNQSKEMEYFEYEGNRFLVDAGVLKDVLVETEVVCIPETVKEIRRQAFLNARPEKRMRTLTIPASVRKIDRLAFAGLAGLCHVEISPGITVLEPGTFRNCPELESIHLPITLRRIESRVFENCTGLYEVILNAERISISEDAFLHCEKLKNSQIEAAIAEDIRRKKEEEEAARNAKYPFLNQTEQEDEQEEAEEEQMPQQNHNQNTEFCIRNGVLEHCEIGCSYIIIPAGVVSIGKNAFAGSEHKELLEKIDIPEGVERLEQRAFYGLSNLSAIHFPSTLSYVGAEALEGTSWLKSKERKIIASV